MDPESEPVHVDVPSDQDLRVGMLRTMEAMFLHAQAGERLLLSIQAQVAGMMSVAGVVDENEARAETDRDVAARKEIITFLYEKSHQYVTVVIAGAFAAYFATLGILSQRFSDSKLLTSALLMTLSLTVFVTWEIGSIIHIGYHSLKGDWGTLTESPRWQRVGWPLAMFFSLCTGLPAIGLSVWVYIRRLGAIDWIVGAFG